MRSGDVPLAYSSCIRRLTNISKTDMSFTSYFRRKGKCRSQRGGRQVTVFSWSWRFCGKAPGVRPIPVPALTEA